MKKTKLTGLLLVSAMAAAMLSGCAGRKGSAVNEAKNEKITISMYLWDRSMLKELSPWLEQEFPDIDFTFIQSFNTIEYY